jgi:hypothetical protein
MAVMAITLYAPFAMAIGEDVALGSFSCAGGTASGNLYLSSATCPTTIAFDNVFTFLTCNMQAIASNLLGHMYCGLIYELEPAIYAAATLAVLFFGISFTIGMTAATGREAIVFLLKIAFVTGFALNADLLIGVAYQLLMSAMSDGIAIVLSGMKVTDASTGNEAFMLLDKFLAQIFNYAIGGAGSVMGEEKCKGAVFAVLATMAVAFPIIAWLALALIGRFLLAFARAVFGYIYAMFAITFLMVMAPFFITFYLFKPTQTYFDKWLGTLASFVIQAVLLFAFLVFILSLPVSNMTQGINSIIMYHEQTQETTAVRLPWRYCTVCDFKIVDKNNKSRTITDKDEGFLEKAELACNIYDVNIYSPSNASFDKTKPATDAAGRKPLSVTFMMAPEAGGATSSDQMNALLKLAGQGIISLLILAILIQELIGIIPALAQRLGMGLGGSYVPQLGGDGNAGISSLRLPGESMIQGFGGGFTKGMRDTADNQWTPQRGQTVSLNPKGFGSGDGAALAGINSAGSSVKSRIAGMAGQRSSSDTNG